MKFIITKEMISKMKIEVLHGFKYPFTTAIEVDAILQENLEQYEQET